MLFIVNTPSITCNLYCNQPNTEYYELNKHKTEVIANITKINCTHKYWTGLLAMLYKGMGAHCKATA